MGRVAWFLCLGESATDSSVLLSLGTLGDEMVIVGDWYCNLLHFEHKVQWLTIWLP